MSYAWTLSEALAYPVRDPFRLLALAVLLRWQEDVREGTDDTPLGEEWLEVADVPDDWRVPA